MDTEVYLQHVVILEDDLLGSSIGRPVRSYVIQAQPGWETQSSFDSITRLETLVASKCSDAVFNFQSKLGHGDSGLDNGLGMLADLAMDLGGFAIVGQERVIHVAHGG